MIMDAIYQSGKLERYKQIFPYTTMAGNNVWVVSIRSIEDDKRISGVEKLLCILEMKNISCE